jgi:hypothetical protein
MEGYQKLLNILLRQLRERTQLTVKILIINERPKVLMLNSAFPFEYSL